MKKIDNIYAWIITEEDGSEGIPAVSIKGLMMPLIGADQARIESFRERAQQIAAIKNLPLKLVNFRGYIVLEEVSS